MHAIPSQIEICNRALQRLGVGTVSSLQDGSVAARALSRVWDPVLSAELRVHPWAFAIHRKVLAADGASPAFGYAYQYSFPAGCLRILPPDDTTHDWRVEGNKILSDTGTGLELRYVAFPHETGSVDPAFAEALAMRIAKELCEELVQNQAKRDQIAGDYERAIREARRAGAFEQIAEAPPEGVWLSIRR